MVKGYLEDRVFWVVLDRPEKLNSLDSGTLVRAREVLSEACRSTASIVAITGEGKFFSAGMDLYEIANAGNPEMVKSLFRKFTDLLETIVSCRGLVGGVEAWTPTIVVLNGPAVAGGAEIAIAADVLVGVKGVYLQWPELRWGLVPPLYAGLMSGLGLPRLVWAGLAIERLSSEEAYRLGLISRLFDSVEEARSYVLKLSETIASNSVALDPLLGRLRRTKMDWLKGAHELVELAGRAELIEAARKFIERR